MFGQLSNHLFSLLTSLRGKQTLNEKNIEAALEDVKIALIEADVNIRVVRRLLAGVREEVLGVRVLGSLSPHDQFVKAINDKLTFFLGEGQQELSLRNPSEVSVVFMVGLQGVGKTTSSAKLAYHFKKRGRTPLLVACDLVRPAARNQLKVLGQSIGVPVFSPEGVDATDQIATLALKEAKVLLCNTVIVDTAGRLEVNEALMQELSRLKSAVNPDETFLVVDAMMGQNSLSVATAFEQKIGFSGILLTKADSDTKGGVALSLKTLTGKGIKFVGTGERVEDLELFYPARMASRILGMGDVVSLAEKAQAVLEEDQARIAQEKLLRGEFTLADYLLQIQSVTKMGGLTSLLSLLPGINNTASASLQDETQQTRLKQEEAIILSMTLKERQASYLLGPSRKRRVAKGSGTTVADLTRLLKRFDQARNMIKKIAKDKNAQKQWLSRMGKQI